jgi:DNA-binding IclR family transcriptional regulator
VGSPDARAVAPGGSRTLARGLQVLQLISESPAGLTIQEVADHLGTHRTVAARVLTTLDHFHLVVRREGRFQPASRLALLAASFDNNLRELSMPVLRELATDTHATASLMIAEGDEQVAIVVVPPEVDYHLTFREGTRYPIDRGAGGMALQAARPSRPGERDLVATVRDQGWVMTHGEAEPNVYGLAVPVKRPEPHPPICVTLVSHRARLLEEARQQVIVAAGELAAFLG